MTQDGYSGADLELVLKLALLLVDIGGRVSSGPWSPEPRPVALLEAVSCYDDQSAAWLQLPRIASQIGKFSEVETLWQYFSDVDVRSCLKRNLGTELGASLSRRMAIGRVLHHARVKVDALIQAKVVDAFSVELGDSPRVLSVGFDSGGRAQAAFVDGSVGSWSGPFEIGHSYRTTHFWSGYVESERIGGDGVERVVFTGTHGVLLKVDGKGDVWLDGLQLCSDGQGWGGALFTARKLTAFWTGVAWVSGRTLWFVKVPTRSTPRTDVACEYVEAQLMADTPFGVDDAQIAIERIGSMLRAINEEVAAPWSVASASASDVEPLPNTCSIPSLS